jgi:hypothetical protein
MNEEERHREEVKNKEGFVRSKRPNFLRLAKQVFGSEDN